MRPFPATTGGRWQVSNGGGVFPVWSRESHSLYFVGSGKLQVADLRTTTGFEVLRLRSLFETSRYTFDLFHQSFAVAPDGQRFLFARPRANGAGATRPTIIMVQNWFAVLHAQLKR